MNQIRHTALYILFLVMTKRIIGLYAQLRMKVNDWKNTRNFEGHVMHVTQTQGSVVSF